EPFSMRIPPERVSPHTSPLWGGAPSRLCLCLQGFRRGSPAVVHPRLRSVLSRTARDSREGCRALQNLPARSRERRVHTRNEFTRKGQKCPLPRITRVQGSGY